MALIKNEFENLDVTISRSSRTEGSERFSVFSDSADESLIFETTHSLIGKLIVEYPSESYIHATLILAGEWEKEAVEALIQEYEHLHIPTTGIGSKPTHGQFGITVHTGAEWLPFDLHDMERLTPEPDRIDEIRRELGETQEMVDSIPEAVANTVDEVVAEQYDDLEEIIESEQATEEKKRAIQKRLQVGLERGLPTAI